MELKHWKRKEKMNIKSGRLLFFFIYPAIWGVFVFNNPTTSDWKLLFDSGWFFSVLVVSLLLLFMAFDWFLLPLHPYTPFNHKRWRLCVNTRRRRVFQTTRQVKMFLFVLCCQHSSSFVDGDRPCFHLGLEGSAKGPRFESRHISFFFFPFFQLFKSVEN